jgi:MoxR-like ATPase
MPRERLSFHGKKPAERVHGEKAEQREEVVEEAEESEPSSKPRVKRWLPLALAQTERERELRAKAEQAASEAEREKFLEEARREHEKALSEAKDLPRDERLSTINTFRRLVRDAVAAKLAAKNEKDPLAQREWLARFSELRREIEALLEKGGPLSFEKAYRAYLASRAEFRRFQMLEDRLREVEHALSTPSYPLSEEKEKEKMSYRLLAARGEALSAEEPEREDLETLQEELGFLYPEGSPEWEKAMEQLRSAEIAPEELPRSKADLEQERDRIMREREELWEDPMVRYFYREHQIDSLLKDMDRGKDVIELPSTIRLLNRLYEWENLHSNITVGGVLVGEPGVGKTTLLRHYLETKGRKYVYLDLSEEVTRYLYFGSKAVELKSGDSYAKYLRDMLKDMSPEDLVKMVKENAANFKRMSNALSEDESVAWAVEALREELEHVSEVDPETGEKLVRAFDEIAGYAFRKELASNFAELIMKNGWRDGIVIHALRNNMSIIFDEYNKLKEWGPLYSLLTHKPGEKWYFGDNNEEVEIPKEWRMYFTANVGRKHGGFESAQALMSRFAGLVMKVEYPPTEEEMLLSLATISGPDGRIHRSQKDVARLLLLVKEAFPRIREAVADERHAIPISLRTIRMLGEKLVRRTVDRRPLYRSTEKDLDEAVWETLVEPYEGHGDDPKVPQKVTKILAEVGFLLTDSLKPRLVGKGYLTEEEFERMRRAHEEHKEDFEELVKELRGEAESSLTYQMPERRTF